MSTTLTTLFGEHPDVRIVAFLAANRGVDFNLSDLARSAGVSRPATYKVVDRLLRDRVLVRTRRVGASWFYALNLESPLVQPLLAFESAPSGGLGRRRRSSPEGVAR